MCTNLALVSRSNLLMQKKHSTPGEKNNQTNPDPENLVFDLKHIKLELSFTLTDWKSHAP